MEKGAPNRDDYQIGEAENIAIGQRIRELRDAECLSQRTFASMVGMNRSLLADIELGRGNPSVKTLCKIAAGLNFDLVDLF